MGKSDIQLKLTNGHGNGQASVAYVRSKAEMLVATAGADGKVCVRDTTLLETLHRAKCEMPPARIIAADPKGKLLAVGDDEYVKLYKLPGLESPRVVCRFSLPVRALAFSPDGTRLAAAGDDNIVKLVDVAEGKVTRSISTDDYVLSVAWDPEGTYLAVVQHAGGLLLYDTVEGRVDKRLEAMCQRVDYTSVRRHAPSWHPDGGSVLALPVGAEGEVVLLERLSWEPTGYLSGEHSQAVNVVAFSPNGLYACTGGQDKRVVVWEVGSASPVASTALDCVVSGVAWRPDGNELALVTETGHVSVWSSPVPPTHPSPTASTEELEAMQRQQEDDADRKRREAKARGAGSQGSGEGALGGEELPPGAVVQEEVVVEEEVAAPVEGAGADAGSGEGEAMEGVEGAGRRAERQQQQQGRARPVVQTVRTVVRTVVAPAGPPGPAPQGAFQPGSTAGVEGGRARFLTYNMIGSVSSKAVEDHHVVEVLFHDASRFASRVPLMTDYYGFDRAALGDKGVLYSSPPTRGSGPGAGGAGAEAGVLGSEPDPDAVPGMLMFRPFEQWAPNGEWTAALPTGEEALCLAVGSTFVAAATSRQLLRLFSLAGSQTLIARLDGPPVAMAAAGSVLMVVWHSGAPNPHTKSQQLSVSLYDTTTLACVATQPLPLSPGATLTWLGFTDDHGLPAVADSEGVVAIRTPDYGGRWVPVFEPPPSKRNTEVLWPVGLTATHMFAVVCKPTDPRPQVNPRPFYTPVDLAPPVLSLEGGSAAHEGQALLEGLSCTALRGRYEAAAAAGADMEAYDVSRLLEGRQAQQDGHLLRAMAKAVKAERHGRALELAAQLNLHKSLEGALRLANACGARALAERISAFITQRQDMEAAAAAAAAGGAYGGPGEQLQQQQHGEENGEEGRDNANAYTPIPYGKRGGAGAASPRGGRQPSQPLAPADLNAPATGGGGITPFAEAVIAEAGPGSALGSLGLSAGPKSTGPKGGLPTPNTLLAAATAKPDPGSDSLKRKPAQTHNNPFARSKAQKTGK